MLSETAKAMAECSASDGGKGQEQDVKRAHGRPRKRPVVEPFEEEVLIEGATAALSSCNLVSCPHPFRKNREGVWQHCHTTVCPARSVQCAPIRLQSSVTSR